MPASKRNDNRASNWALTMNMDKVRREYLDDCIGKAIQLGWEVSGQEEIGEKNGVRHYQVHLHTPQVRFSAVKAVFPTAHIEKARNKFASQNYANKSETRVGSIDFKNIENKFVQYKDVRDKFYEWLIQEYEAPEMIVDRTEVWDQFIGLSIEQGIECDVIGVNPQYRSCIQKYWIHEMRKACLKKTASVDKTDSQTSETISGDSSITSDGQNSEEPFSSVEEEEDTEDDHVEWIEDSSYEGSDASSSEDCCEEGGDETFD